MQKLIGIITAILILSAACSGGSEFPRQGAISSTLGPLGVRLLSQVEDNGRICVMSAEYRIANADGSELRISPGTRVETLEEATCARDPQRPYKIRVIDRDIVGWVPRNGVTIDE